MAKSQSLVINCDDGVQILLCCAICVCYGLLCFHLLSACYLIGYCSVSRYNLQIKRAFVLGVRPTQQDFWFAIGAPPMFFRANSVTLNTPHTTKKSEKLIFRTTKIIGTLPRIVGRGEIGPKSAQLSCGVYQALFLKKISVNLAPGSYISSLSSLLLFFYFTPSSIVILEFGSVPDFLYWCLPPSVPPSLWSPHTPLFWGCGKGGSVPMEFK